MKIPQLVCASCLCLLATATARADFIVTVGNVSLGPGSTGYLPVYIKSDSSDALAITSFEFRITTGGPRRLEFLNSPSPASDPTFSDPTYVFAGNSLDEDLNLPLGVAALATVPNDSFIGGDATADFSDVAVSTSDFLLAMLPINAATALPPIAGDTFTITLVPPSAPGLDANTGFADSSAQFSEFSSIPGSVLIVPEPSVLTLLIVACIVIASYLLGGGMSVDFVAWSIDADHQVPVPPRF
ncbi:MAG: hypothetical protein AB7O59_24490 [Pirellulales bacterium]